MTGPLNLSKLPLGEQDRGLLYQWIGYVTIPNRNLHDKQLYQIRAMNCKGWGPWSDAAWQEKEPGENDQSILPSKLLTTAPRQLVPWAQTHGHIDTPTHTAAESRHTGTPTHGHTCAQARRQTGKQANTSSAASSSSSSSAAAAAATTSCWLAFLCVWDPSHAHTHTAERNIQTRVV